MQDDQIKRITQQKDRWQRETLDPFLKKTPERQAPGQTTSGIEKQRIPLPDSESPDYLENVNFPGQFPYTRGIQPTMYRGRLWTMRQYAGFGTAAETNKRFIYLLDQGQTGLSVAFDLPTQMGYDSDAPLARGEVGKVGVAIDSVDDMMTLMNDIPLDKVSTSMTINSTSAILLAMYIVAGEKQGVDKGKLRGTIQNDILKEYIARGTYILPPRPSMRIITDIFAFCSKEVPNFNTISISGYHMREAGCTAVQEVAFTLADGISYVSAALDVGLDLDVFAKRLSFFFCVHNEFLEEIAKFRAARRLWARIMRDRFGAKSEKSCMLRFHTQTAGCSLTAQQPQNNLIRVTMQALAAVLGGTQSLHTNSYDEALALPSEESVRLALRTQQLIAEETGVANTMDPLGGSYEIERLTDEIEQRAEEYIKKIDDIGGMVSAIEQGYVQQEIQDSSYEFQLEVEKEERIVVGVNRFITDNYRVPEITRVSENVERDQVGRLKKYKAARDQAALEKALKQVKNAAQGEDNLMPPIVAAVRAGATLGEISDVLVLLHGRYQENVVV
jgi:methylmalonyl-CoA mutase, N-terminal domain